MLQPGVTPAEAASITDVVVAPGNVLDVGGDVSVAREGRVAVTIRSDDTTPASRLGEPASYKNASVTLTVKHAVPARP